MFSIFKNINYYAGKSKLADNLAIFCARILPYLMAVFLLIFSILERKYQTFFFPALCGIMARLLNELVHMFYKQDRPSLSENIKTLISVPKNYSFPSGHASVFFGVSFCLFLYNFDLAIIFLVLSCIMGLSRVFCGVHRLKDIVGGIIVGAVSALIAMGLVIL